MGSGSGAGLGTLAGGAAGAFFGGPAGAMAGASLGGALGGMLDPQTVDTSGFSPSPQEMAFMRALQARSQGAGPSVAEGQLQQGLGQANANAAGMAAASRGIAPGLAARLGQQAMSDNSMQINQQAAILRAQEQQQADALLAQMYASQRGSAGQAATIQANNSNQARQQNMGMMQGLGTAGIQYAGMSGKSQPQTPPAGPAVQMNKGGKVPCYDDGGKIPGKANVAGNSPKNDTVDAKLSPGEIVVPRTDAQDPEKAKAFIDKLFEKEGGKSAGKGGSADIKELMKIQRETLKRISELEKALKDEDELDAA